MQTIAAASVMCCAVGCAPKSDQAIQPWRFEARTTHGVVRVMPPVALIDPTPLAMNGYVGAGIPWIREWLRGQRTDEIAEVPLAVATALPAALTHQLGADFDATFLTGHFRPGERGNLRAALHSPAGLDAALTQSVRGLDGQAALYTWVRSLHATPLTAHGFAGDILDTPAGPAVGDHFDEPYLLEARVGMALVAQDGEVVIRYSEDLCTVLSSRRSPQKAGKELARALAAEVVKVWAVDPRLEDGAPSDVSMAWAAR
jgi:hypothetical protein